MDPPPRHLADLPDELLQQVLRTTDEQTVVACGQACSAWADLMRSEEIWEAMCKASWPLMHRLPQPPPCSSWRSCHQARCLGTPPGTWRRLLPLYDESVVLASERPGGWIGRLGSLLLRIRSLRKLHSMEEWPLAPTWDSSGSGSGPGGGVPRSREVMRWLRSLHEELSTAAAAEAVLSFAGGAPLYSVRMPTGDVETAEEEVMRRGGVGAWLDDWYEATEDPAPLLRFLAGRSALQAVSQLLGVNAGAKAARKAATWLLREEKEEAQAALQAAASDEERAAAEAAVTAWEQAAWRQAVGGHGAQDLEEQLRRNADEFRRLGRALDTLDAALCSLHDEGCDLSVTAAQQREANAAGSLPRSHWWWRLEAPAYVSGGNPLIAPLPAEAALAGD